MLMLCMIIFKDIKNSVFSELKSSSKIDIYRRNLQKNFVETLIENSSK